MNSDLLAGAAGYPELEWCGIVDRVSSDLLAALNWCGTEDRMNSDLLVLPYNYTHL